MLATSSFGPSLHTVCSNNRDSFVSSYQKVCWALGRMRRRHFIYWSLFTQEKLTCALLAPMCLCRAVETKRVILGVVFSLASHFILAVHELSCYSRASKEIDATIESSNDKLSLTQCSKKQLHRVKVRGSETPVPL